MHVKSLKQDKSITDNGFVNLALHTGLSFIQRMKIIKSLFIDPVETLYSKSFFNYTADHSFNLALLTLIIIYFTCPHVFVFCYDIYRQFEES